MDISTALWNGDHFMVSIGDIEFPEELLFDHHTGIAISTANATFILHCIRVHDPVAPETGQINELIGELDNDDPEGPDFE